MFWQVLGTYEGEPITFDRWEVAFLRDHSRLRAAEKAPQIGFSWTCAAEALWEAVMFRDAATAFVSVSEREAQEKILYARKLYEGLPAVLRRWVPLVRESTEELWLGDSASPSRVRSFAATSSLRGPAMNVYMDEADFYRDGGEETFRVALGRIARGYRLTIGSTCFGTDTVLARIVSGALRDQARRFSVARLPWHVAENELVRESVELARSELEAADFEEEYLLRRGAAEGDEFPPDLLRRATGKQAVLEPSEVEPGTELVAGYDVGATRHPSVLTVLRPRGPGEWEQVVVWEARAGREPMDLPAQEAFLDALLGRLPGMVLALDAHGIGMQIAQGLSSRHGRRVLALHPNAAPQPHLPKLDRLEAVTEVRRALEAGELRLAPDRQQALEFRRTRRVEGRVDQPGKKRRSHYDRFWATAYAWYAVRASAARTSVYDRRGLRVLHA